MLCKFAKIRAKKRLDFLLFYSNTFLTGCKGEEMLVNNYKLKIKNDELAINNQKRQKNKNPSS